jgi:L-asparaginase / beta-aspartyl-peptidase
MDASVMDSKGSLGIVIALREIRNPVLAARAVMATPHAALSGEGAAIFARLKGFEPLGPVPEAVLERHRQILTVLRAGDFSETYPRWKDADPESLWNFGTLSYGSILQSDTIGAVAIDRQGNLAAANSTGGAPPMLLGRVGDAPMIGCGFFAGPACAIAATGLGEEIMKKMLAKTVYDLVVRGDSVSVACEKGLAMFPPEIAAGLIAISPQGFAVVANREMASYALVREH